MCERVFLLPAIDYGRGYFEQQRLTVLATTVTSPHTGLVIGLVVRGYRCRWGGLFTPRCNWLYVRSVHAMMEITVKHIMAMLSLGGGIVMVLALLSLRISLTQRIKKYFRLSNDSVVTFGLINKSKHRSASSCFNDV
jgi:hypothetical protein